MVESVSGLRLGWEGYVVIVKEGESIGMSNIE
jgi:hypothetical protein